MGEDVCITKPVGKEIQSNKTKLAKTVIRCLIEMQPLWKFTITLLSQILIGSVSVGLDKLINYGKGKDFFVERKGTKQLVNLCTALFQRCFQLKIEEGFIANTVGDVNKYLSGSFMDG